MKNPHIPVTLEDTRTCVLVRMDEPNVANAIIEITGIARGVMTGRPADARHAEARGMLLVADHASKGAGASVRCWQWRAIPGTPRPASDELSGAVETLYLGTAGGVRKTKPTAKGAVVRAVGTEYPDGAVVLAPSASFG